MQYVHLSQMDLNSLLALQALLEERHITRAAERCALSQSAMSRVLARLREALGDDLIVRTGREYERTSRGERLLHELNDVLPRLEALVRGQDFDPLTAEERFRVTTTDHAAVVIIPGVMRQLRTHAPGIQLEVSAWDDLGYDHVEAGGADLALGVGSAPTPPPSLKVEALYEEEFVCLVDAANPFEGDRFSLSEYLDCPHAAVSTAYGQQTMIDRPLVDLAMKRRIVFWSPYFVASVLAIVGTDVVLTIPKRLATALSGLVSVRQVAPPKEIAGFTYSMAWHPRVSGDPAHAWFREQVRIAVRGLLEI